MTFEKERDFHEKEEIFVSITYKEIEKNNKFIFDILNKIDKNIIFQDYITYYLQKHYNKNGIYKINDIYHKLIELLLKLRFDDKKKIKDNENNQVNILLIKIIWIESNINYILNILKIIEFAIEIFNNDEEKLFKTIEELISKKNIKYITNEKRNPKHTKEVNECYYILLASICYTITSDKIILSYKEKENEIEIHLYYSKLNEINKILQLLNVDLYIYLNEMYIIDELIKIIELLNYNIEKIIKIKNALRESALILQKYASNDSENKFQINDTNELFNEELINNFREIYSLIKKENANQDYYNKLGYICFKEIKKVLNINYRFEIFGLLIEENKIIKKSIAIFQILLKNNFTKFENTISNLLNGREERSRQINRLIDYKLNDENSFLLTEILLYFFEKNSLIYLKKILTQKSIKKQYLENEPLSILKDCIRVLDYYIFKPQTLTSKLKEICKLFCLGYIKTYCYTFIKMLDENKPKCEDPKKIIDVINGKNSIYIK